MMTKDQFLSKLGSDLHKLPKAEREAILADYAEHFELGILQGRTESEIAERLGQPKELAKEILANVRISEAQSNPSFRTVMQAVLASLSLGLFNILFALLPFICGVTIILSLFFTAITCFASPILMLIQEGLTLTFLTYAFLLLGLVGVGILLFLAAIKLTVLFYTWMIRYLRFNLELVGRNRQ